MSFACDAIMAALTDDWQTTTEIARKSGMNPVVTWRNLTSLAVYRMAERGPKVACPHGGAMSFTWRRVR